MFSKRLQNSSLLGLKGSFRSDKGLYFIQIGVSNECLLFELLSLFVSGLFCCNILSKALTKGLQTTFYCSYFRTRTPDAFI